MERRPTTLPGSTVFQSFNTDLHLRTLRDVAASLNDLGATHIEYTVAGVNRQFTLTQGASGTSQIFPVKKLQANFCSGNQSVGGVNRNVRSP